MIQHVIAIGSIENLIQGIFAQKFEATPKLIQHIIAIGSIENLIQAMFTQKFEACGWMSSSSNLDIPP